MDLLLAYINSIYSETNRFKLDNKIINHTCLQFNNYFSSIDFNKKIRWKDKQKCTGYL